MALPYVGFFAHHQTRTAKKEFRERQRRKRGNFGDVCEEFLPNRPKNDAHFLNLLKMSILWPLPFDKIGLKIAVHAELLQWADFPHPSIVLCCGAAQGRIVAVA